MKQKKLLASILKNIRRSLTATSKKYYQLRCWSCNLNLISDISSALTVSSIIIHTTTNDNDYSKWVSLCCSTLSNIITTGLRSYGMRSKLDTLKGTINDLRVIEREILLLLSSNIQCSNLENTISDILDRLSLIDAHSIAVKIENKSDIRLSNSNIFSPSPEKRELKEIKIDI